MLRNPLRQITFYLRFVCCHKISKANFRLLDFVGKSVCWSSFVNIWWFYQKKDDKMLLVQRLIKFWGSITTQNSHYIRRISVFFEYLDSTTHTLYRIPFKTWRHSLSYTRFIEFKYSASLEHYCPWCKIALKKINFWFKRRCAVKIVKTIDL